MKVQFIEENGERKFAVLPMSEFERLMEELETLEDIRLYREAKTSNDEYFPIELVDRLLGGKNPVAVFREYRGMSVEELTTAAGLARAEIEAVEADLRAATAEMLARIAAALRLEVDDLTAAPAAEPE